MIICMLRTIYSRFKGSGIVELLSEAGVGTEGTIQAAMKGSNVKQGVRYYKLLFEALLRTKLAHNEKQRSSRDRCKLKIPAKALSSQWKTQHKIAPLLRPLTLPATI